MSQKRTVRDNERVQDFLCSSRLWHFVCVYQTQSVKTLGPWQLQFAERLTDLVKKHPHSLGARLQRFCVEISLKKSNRKPQCPVLTVLARLSARSNRQCCAQLISSETGETAIRVHWKYTSVACFPGSKIKTNKKIQLELFFFISFRFLSKVFPDSILRQTALGSQGARCS